MKTKQFFLGMLAAAALVGCSSDDTVSSDSNATLGDGTPRYMSINILSESGTRAGSYEDGSDTENAVAKVRFYFFTSDGNAANVKKQTSGAYVNYYDWTPDGTSTGDPAETVEKKINATVVISTPEGDRVPSKMVAVLNPDKITTLGNRSLGLYELRSIKQDWAALTDQENGFVMMNSVYASATKERISTSTVATENLCKTADLAKQNPVNIYVERNVAKVSLKFSSDITLNNNGVYKLQNEDGSDVVINDGTQNITVYAKPLYWTLTATTKQANLSKHINPTWKTDLFSSTEPWNTVDYHRSFWAVNCLTGNYGTSGEDNAGTNYYSFNQINAMDHAMGGTDVIYTNENAATNYETGLQREFPTQVIGTTQLTDKDGNVLNIVEFAGTKYIGEDNLKKAMLASIKESLFTKETDVTSETYNQIDVEDVTFQTEGTYNSDLMSSQEKTGRYNVRLILSDTGKAKDWYTHDGKNYVASTATAINTVLASVGTGKFWKEGRAYYYFKVRHLANEDAGMYGVVRNHTYVCTVNSIVGLGTPVYNPDEVIYPETPVDEHVYIGAKINILQWRLVPSTVSLGKTE